MAEQEQQTQQDPFAKKPQDVQAALGAATDWKILAAGGVAGFLFAGGNIPLGMAAASAVNAAVAVKREHDEVQNERVSSVDKTKNDTINWGAAGLTVGALLAATTPVGWVAVPAIAIASNVVGGMLESNEKKELEAQKSALADEQLNNAYNAGVMENSDPNSAVVGTGKFTSLNKSRKSNGNNIQQQIMEQRAKEQEMAQSGQLAGVG